MTRLLAGVLALLLVTTGAWVSLPRPVAAANPFADIGGSLFQADIDWAYVNGITTGCSPTAYCPDNVVTREQMASFLVRMFALPTTTVDFFADDAENCAGSSGRLA